MKSVTVIGMNSNLARYFLATATGAEAMALSHDAIGDAALPESGCIVNFAYPWAYMTDAYVPENDFERTIIERIEDTDAHLVMLSSRKVYDRAGPCPWYESSALAGQSIYGDNKIITEDFVREALPGRHTILRLGNLIEMEPGRHTFLGIALETLKRDGRISLDVAPETKRDFLPVTHFAAALEKVVHEKPLGVFNLASGLETAVGNVASWIVEGFGSGEVVSTDDIIKDTFVLDVSHLQSIIGPICDHDDIREACLESGRKLESG